MPLPEFANEADFREKWIRPFLSKMGFVHVNHTHGPGEQGKDFFFADYDRFEHQRFYAVQAKNGNIGAGGKELGDLLNQVQRCFTVKLRFHKEAHERRVSAVYIMASGKISPEAREFISDWCRTNCFGENVYYLDGDTLERLDRHAFQRKDEAVRSLLIGLMNESKFNLAVLEICKSALESKHGCFNRTRHSTLERYLAEPPDGELIPHAMIAQVWELSTRINTVCEHHLISIGVPPERWTDYLAIANRAIVLTKGLFEAAEVALFKLNSRYTVNLHMMA